jgi:hypothetical protein
MYIYTHIFIYESMIIVQTRRLSLSSYKYIFFSYFRQITPITGRTIIKYSDKIQSNKT